MKQINLLSAHSPYAKKSSRAIGVIIAFALSILSFYFIRYGSYGHFPMPDTQAHLALQKVLVPQYPIGRLKMVGYLSQADSQAPEALWGLLESPDGQVTTVHIGDRVGQEAAGVINIRTSGILLKSTDQAESSMIRITSETV